MLAFLLSGRRDTFPRTWHVIYFLLVLAQVVLLCWQPGLWLNGESVSGIGLALVVADIVALIWLLTKVLLCWQPGLWLNGESVSGIGLALVVADIVALIWLLTNRRFRACLNEDKD